MLAIFNVGSVAAPSNAMTSSTYVFGSLNGNGLSGLNSARGTYVNPSNFGARDAAVFNNGANTPVSRRNGQLLSSIGGYANQQLVTAETVGANTPTFLTSISTAAGGVQPCNCESTQWGFWSAFNGATNNGKLTFEDQGALLLWVAGNPTTVGSLPASGTATYPATPSPTSPTGLGVLPISPRHVFDMVNFDAAAARSRSAVWTERTTRARRTFAPKAPTHVRDARRVAVGG